MSDFLSKYSINNAFELKEFDESFARKKRGIVLQRTIVELKGIVCNEVENLLVKKNQYASPGHLEKKSMTMKI